MRDTLVTRIQKLFRRSNNVPEGADTSDEHWADLPYGGAAAPVDRETELEWNDLQSWDRIAAPVRASSNLAVPTTADRDAAADAQEWAAALARAKSAPSIRKSAGAAPPDEEAEWLQSLARAKARAEGDRVKSLDEESEWRALIERAKARPASRRDLGSVAKAVTWMRTGAKTGAVG